MKYLLSLRYALIWFNCVEESKWPGRYAKNGIFAVPKAINFDLLVISSTMMPRLGGDGGANRWEPLNLV